MRVAESVGERDREEEQRCNGLPPRRPIKSGAVDAPLAT